MKNITLLNILTILNFTALFTLPIIIFGVMGFSIWSIVLTLLSLILNLGFTMPFLTRKHKEYTLMMTNNYQESFKRGVKYANGAYSNKHKNGKLKIKTKRKVKQNERH